MLLFLFLPLPLSKISKFKKEGKKLGKTKYTQMCFPFPPQKPFNEVVPDDF